MQVRVEIKDLNQIEISLKLLELAEEMPEE